ncbi:MAG: cyclic nucleotide-binding domain-containing protein [Candidatus Cloacimonetes bacterium]|nr:cyclic nucleotide-binding domain-containing protein [Candidatus Cloacimonadota bacterium]
MCETVDYLKTHYQENPLFKYFNQQEFDYFLSLTETVEYEANQIIFHKGQEARGFFLILKGKIRVQREKEAEKPKVLADIEAPTVLGEMGLMAKRVRTSTALCLEPSTVLFFNKQKYLELLEKNDLMAFKLSHNVGTIVGEKMEAMNVAMMDMRAKFKEFTQFKASLFSDWNF